jgi:F-type H+-transporting ATPase subunit b
MLIDWFTVAAQMLNFLVLVWLMKRFLYKPVLSAIDSREKRIAAQLADADTQKTEAHKERDEFQEKNAAFDRQCAMLLSKATDDANTERQHLLTEARKAADAAGAIRQESLRHDAQNLSQAIAHRTQQEVFAIVRKTLTDLATANLEEQMRDVFTRRLTALNGQAKEDLGEALKTATDPALLRSTFDLSAEQRVAIQYALNTTFSADIKVQFETALDQISGIELTTKGQKVAWSIADYLTSMQKGVVELLQENEKAKAKDGSSSDAVQNPK